MDLMCRPLGKNPKYVNDGADQRIVIHSKSNL